jgi:hypothetical protein
MEFWVTELFNGVSYGSAMVALSLEGVFKQ